jgi:hypothetical protein
MTTLNGNPNWVALSEQLGDVSYESLRKAVTGERVPSQKIMEAVATALKVDASVFVEYRLLKVQKQFDAREVGVDVAAANLEKWVSLGG